MTHVGIGVSNKKSPKAAVHNAYTSVQKQLKEVSPQIIFLFSSLFYNQKTVVEHMTEICPKEALVVGMSTPTLMTQGRIYDDAIGMFAISSTTIQFDSVFSRLQKADPKRMGEDLVSSYAHMNLEPNLFILFYDGLFSYQESVLGGIKTHLGEHFPIVGAASSDNYLFKKTYQYFQHRAFQRNVVGVACSGNFSFGVGVSHGWASIGISGVVTMSKGSRVYTIDKKPAVEFYRSFFEQQLSHFDKEPLSQSSVTYPLGIDMHEEGRVVVRSPYMFYDDGSIEFLAEVPEGSLVQLMIGGKEESFTAARIAIKQARDFVSGNTLAGALLFMGLDRKKFLGRKYVEEVEVIRHELKDTPFLGVYGYSVVGPVSGQLYRAPSAVQNESIVALLLAEE